MLAKLRRTLIAARFTATTPNALDPNIIRDYQLACAAADAAQLRNSSSSLTLSFSCSAQKGAILISDDAKEVLLQRLAGLPTTVITDAMDRFGTLDPAIKPVWEGARVCGLASTVHSREGDNLGIHELLERAQPGRVVVVAAGGAISRALIGELIAERAVNAKVAGFVIDGAVRDVQGIEETGLPVFARGVSAAGPYRDGPYRLGRPVAVGGTVVNEDDIVCGDADGVVVVPLGRAEEVCQLAEEKMQLEVDTRAATIRSRS